MSAVVEYQANRSLLTRVANKYGVDPDKMMTTLKATAFKGDVSNEQMMALLIVAEQHNLNPWTKEIYAFPDRNHGIVPVVGVDGWARIINSHPDFDGMDFEEAEDGASSTARTAPTRLPLASGFRSVSGTPGRGSHTRAACFATRR
jgi:phage recombination protein Bet